MILYSELLRFVRTEDYREGQEVLISGDFIVRGDTITIWPVTSLTVWRLHYNDEDCEKAETKEGEKWIRQEHFPEILPNNVKTEHGTIRPGEFVVHPHHGVGIFERISTLENLKEEGTFISLLYAGNDRLLFPNKRAAELMPYIGSRHPRLTRLYSTSWQRTKERIAKDLIRIARELLRTYAKRQLTTRPPYKPADDWQHLVDQGAHFVLTEDQKRALAEVSHDLFNQDYPMDRLICGDVGFGKTEVAIRAAVPVLAAGKQVALIAPTTVLAEQHYVLLRDRFAPLPVRIEHLSRLTDNNDKEVVAKLNANQVDLIVGTHRLLGKDVEVTNLGLLILDEEQKFGVAQKERLKQLRPSVDVLSLSATPIPRTLSMSLSGLRGLSILRTAPEGRKSVETIVKPFDETIIKTALQEELSRDGQIYVVHNRVQSLPIVLHRIEQLVMELGFTEKRVVMAHGQMDEKHLAQSMSDFMAGKIDVLVASSIVEHGLDSPGANTLIVLHSERFGLSDLYQLRGRVGRRTTQAKAYFLLGGFEYALYEQGVEEALHITDTAQKRLQALKEADILGSGWSIALRDLEIRGGGNILGHEQHGNMETIGLLLYAQLLQEEIGKQAKQLDIPLFDRRELEPTV